MSSEHATRLEAYCQAWSSSLALLLSQLTSTDWQSEIADGGSQPVASLRITVQGGVEGDLWLNLDAGAAGPLLEIFLGEAVQLGAELDDTQKPAIEELVRQWAGLAVSSLKPDFGELTLQTAMDTSQPLSGQARLLRASSGDRSIAVGLVLGDTLVRALEASQSNPDGEPELQAKLVLPAAAATPSQARIEDLLRSGNLELLMDVELAVMLRFGSRQATLREVLELATGAVLELDREIQEPVDLLLNGKVIARGDVVVVDGNYGLRVTEVASPQQRANSL